MQEFQPYSIAEAAPASADGMLDEDRLKQIKEKLSSLSGLRILPLEFDKDDNNHMDFIAASSNLRAEIYGIAPIDRDSMREMLMHACMDASIPSNSSTASLVCGLISFELLKLVSHTMGSGHSRLNDGALATRNVRFRR